MALNLKRRVSTKISNILYTRSGDQCAHPECDVSLIEDATEESVAHSKGEICHIYAANIDGPRGRTGLTEEELNSLDNLILLCRNHHSVVDGQHESYPVSMLKQWKRDHEWRVKQQQTVENLEKARSDQRSAAYQTELVDERIMEETHTLRKSRHFSEFDSTKASLELGRRLTVDELKDGSPARRRDGLAWCARMLCRTNLAAAEGFVEAVITLGGSSELGLTEAIIGAAKGDYSGALALLADLGSPASRTAGLTVVARDKGNAAAVEWLRLSGVSPEDLDADGLLFLLSMELELARWDSAAEIARIVTDDDLAAAPALWHQVAIAVLLTTVPLDYRAIVRDQLPLDLSGFPFGSDKDAVEALRFARDHFNGASSIEKQLKLVETAKLDEKYSMWLDLKDIDSFDDAKMRLEVRLRDGESALHLVPLGIQFGIKIDLDAVEKGIERTEALRGRITSDTATARFALALTEGIRRSIRTILHNTFASCQTTLARRRCG